MTKQSTVIAIFLMVFASTRLDAGVLLPDISVGPINGMYDNNGQLQLMGAATPLLTENGTEDIFFNVGGASVPGMFSLAASVDSNGLSSGNFSIQGTFDATAGTLGSPNDPNVVLLSGTLTEVRTAAFSSGKLSFVSDQNIGGTLAPLFGDEVVINLDTGGQFNSFTVMMFTGGSADVGKPVPEPGSAMMWAMLALAPFVVRKRKTSKTAGPAETISPAHFA